MDKTATAMPVYRETHRYVKGRTCSPMAVIRAIMQAKPTNSVLTRRGRQRRKDMFLQYSWKRDAGCQMSVFGARGDARRAAFLTEIRHPKSLFTATPRPGAASSGSWCPAGR